MGLTNFTSPNDDDDNQSNTGSGAINTPFGGGAPSSPLIPQPSSNDIEDLLVNYNERFKAATPALFRDSVIEQTVAVLIRRDKPNPLLVGPAGVGKTRIVEEIARMIYTQHPAIPAALKDQTIYELPMASLVAGAGIVGQLEQRVTDLVNYASDPKNKAILFIDEIHTLADSRDPIYSKVSQILKPALARGDMHIIGATTTQESRSLSDDPAFQRRFARLIVNELTHEQTVEVLKEVRSSYLAHHNRKVSVSDETLTLVASIADQYSSSNQHRPDNAVTLLDQALADLVVNHSTAIARAQQDGNTSVAQALQSIPVLTLTEQKLKSVAIKIATGVAERAQFNETELRESLATLYGQDDVLEELMDALRRDQLGAFARTKPNAWMLAGPSGSGKTETVKRISKHLTGQPPIMLNMGEFAHAHDTSKLIGSGPGYVGSDSNKELPFDTLESNPYRVILLDEFEKADRAIHRLFLTALDEGWMRTADGRVVDFSKATIIATTNAARDIVGKTPVGFVADSAQSTRPDQQLLISTLKESFDAELLGRFQKVVAYSTITSSDYRCILAQAYKREQNRLLRENPRLGALVPDLDDALLDETVKQTYLSEQGARPAENAARKLIEDAILDAQQAAQQHAKTQPALLTLDDDNNPTTIVT